MALRPDHWLSRRHRRQAAQAWRALAGAADGAGAGTGAGGGDLPGGAALGRLRDEAGAARRDLARFLARTDPRSRRGAATLAQADLPGGTDWRWRPEALAQPLAPRGIVAPDPGQWLCPGFAVWHDCPHHALAIAQSAGQGAAPFALGLDVFGFAGSYLSLSIDLPAGMLDGLRADHIIRLDAALGAERPIDIYARLQIEHGPNTDAINRHLGRVGGGGGAQVVEFDLAFIGLNEQRLQKAWLDLIVEAPLMNAITLSDLIVSRHPRAEF